MYLAVHQAGLVLGREFMHQTEYSVLALAQLFHAAEVLACMAVQVLPPDIVMAAP